MDSAWTLAVWGHQESGGRVAGSLEMVLVDLPWGGGISKVYGKVGGMAPAPKPHHLVSNTSWIYSDLYTPGQAADSLAGYEHHRVFQQGVQRLGLLHSLKLMPICVECSILEWWHLQCGKVTQHRSPGTKLSLFSCYSSPLCTPFARPQGEWLQMRFCALAL